jgi:cysteine synthase
MDKKRNEGGCGCKGNCPECGELVKKAEALKILLPHAEHSVKHRLAKLILEDGKKNGATEDHRKLLDLLFH